MKILPILIFPWIWSNTDFDLVCEFWQIVLGLCFDHGFKIYHENEAVSITNVWLRFLAFQIKTLFFTLLVCWRPKFVLIFFLQKKLELLSWRIQLPILWSITAFFEFFVSHLQSILYGQNCFLTVTFHLLKCSNLINSHQNWTRIEKNLG